MNLSIVLTALNEEAYCRATIASIRATAPHDLPIFVIDDASTTPLVLEEDEYVLLVRNPERIGCAASRQKGIEMASTTHVLTLDAHMVASPDWFPNLMRKIERQPKTFWNCACLGLSEKNMDITKHHGEYRGATFNFYGIDKNKPSFKQIAECIWKNHEDGELCGAYMGAAYVFVREEFLRLRGFTGLRMWGGDEFMASTKVHLSGNELRMAADVKFGHLFRSVAPYRTTTWHLVWNKIWMILTLFGDSPPALFMLGKLREITPEVDWKLCMAELIRQQPAIVEEYRKNKEVFVRDLRWICDTFKVAYPE